ncbi:hypothetical protein ACO34A_06910 [Rhizobium sp. ACO-34A]|nr:hypothetical protein ACO34A_06910 [Rhizobium sp. ACO-34A]
METAGRRPLLRLLRVSLKGPLTIIGMEGATALLEAEDGATFQVPLAVLRHSVSSGLLSREGNRLTACEGTRTWLRRAMASNGASNGASDGEDAFAGQHRDIVTGTVEVAQVRTTVRRNMAESPLSALSRLKEKSGEAYLGEEALAAGDRFAADFERAGLQPRITASWEPRLASRVRGQPSAAGDLTDSALGARDRLNAAIEAVGPELSGVVLDVCCFMKGLETVERERQWPARSAKLMLRTGLMALARHYAPPSRQSRRAHRWGAGDYRPELG